MLRLLDLPALLELRLPRGSEPRWVALTGMNDEQVFLSIGGETVAIDNASLDRFWFGEAHVLWRDFEALGRTGDAARALLSTAQVYASAGATLDARSAAQDTASEMIERIIGIAFICLRIS